LDSVHRVGDVRSGGPPSGGAPDGDRARRALPTASLLP
jgi:hypothetical protein